MEAMKLESSDELTSTIDEEEGVEEEDEILEEVVAAIGLDEDVFLDARMSLIFLANSQVRGRYFSAEGKSQVLGSAEM
jgi:hypothetical protein